MNMTNTPEMTYRTMDSYVHPNKKGTGSACTFELHPAHGKTDGSIFLTIAKQRSVAADGEFAKFDWENKMVIKLNKTDLSQILQVLRGIKESAGGEKGIFHSTSRAKTVIKFYHQLGQFPGYMLTVSRKTTEGEVSNAWFMFDFSEAFVLAMSLEHAMMYVCFGIPEVRVRRAVFSGIPQMPIMVKPVQSSGNSDDDNSSDCNVDDGEQMLKVSGDPF